MVLIFQLTAYRNGSVYLTYKPLINSQLLNYCSVDLNALSPKEWNGQIDKINRLYSGLENTPEISKEVNVVWSLYWRIMAKAFFSMALVSFLFMLASEGFLDKEKTPLNVSEYKTNTRAQFQNNCNDHGRLFKEIILEVFISYRPSIGASDILFCKNIRI